MRLYWKQILLCGLSIIVLVISAYYLLLPLDRKLQLFCVLDDAHLAQPQPIWILGRWPRPFAEYVNGYWANPNTGTKLTMVTIWEAIDGGMWLYCDNTENVFWIGVQLGPMTAAFYGPYQGILWTLTNIINPLALIGIAISIMTLLYPLVHRVLQKEHARNPPRPTNSTETMLNRTSTRVLSN